MAKLDISQEEKEVLLKNFPEGLVAFDLETTGLSPLIDKIVEISAVKLMPSGEIENFDQLVNPGILIDPAITEIHGITNQMVENKPALSEVLPEWESFVDNLSLVAHNAQFDCGFLVFAYHQLKKPLPTNKAYCSIKLSRAGFKDVKNYKLKTLASIFDIPLENHHRALDDALASLRIFSQALLKKAPRGKSYLFRLNDFNLDKLEELPEHLQPLVSKVAKQQLVDIKYKGGSHKGVFRPIRPISLLPMPKGNILYAHCLLSDIYKSFALNKITEVKELNAKEIQDRLFHKAKKADK